jgi:hypothetical protein
MLCPLLSLIAASAISSEHTVTLAIEACLCFSV